MYSRAKHMAARVAAICEPVNSRSQLDCEGCPTLLSDCTARFISFARISIQACRDACAVSVEPCNSMPSALLIMCFSMKLDHVWPSADGDGNHHDAVHHLLGRHFPIRPVPAQQLWPAIPHLLAVQPGHVFSGLSAVHFPGQVWHCRHLRLCHLHHRLGHASQSPQHPATLGVTKNVYDHACNCSASQDFCTLHGLSSACHAEHIILHLPSF